MTHRSMVAACGLILLAASACNRAPASEGSPKAGEASAATTRANAAVAQSLPLGDTLDMADAKRGLVARPTGRILRADSTVAMDFAAPSRSSKEPRPPR